MSLNRKLALGYEAHYQVYHTKCDQGPVVAAAYPTRYRCLVAETR
jgi:hypothetical protein